MDPLISEYCHLKAGLRPDLDQWPTKLPKSSLDLDKAEGQERLNELGHRIAELQRKLWAERKHKVLVVLQGMDTSGKDGTIRHVFRFTHPNGVNVAPFDKPTRRELAYDYLWRIHQRVPHKGEIVIFDRSHYEDIVTVRVKSLQPERVWSRRYKHINGFEEMLADEGVSIVKFFLHISKEEQKERLEARLEDPQKHWKFDESDIEARNLWDSYIGAYSETLQRCNATHAPWFIIPADKKWQRNLLVAHIIIRTLEALNMDFPAPDFEPGSITIA